MNHIYHPAAEPELLEELRYYRDIDFELGTDLDRRINAAICEICKFPFSYRLREGAYRRINLGKFPFYLPYIIREGTVIILAIAHNSRHPDYWRKRLT